MPDQLLQRPGGQLLLVRLERDQVVRSQPLEPVGQPAVQLAGFLVDDQHVEQLLLDREVLLRLDGHGQAAKEVHPRQGEQPMPRPLFLHPSILRLCPRDILPCRCRRESLEQVSQLRAQEGSGPCQCPVEWPAPQWYPQGHGSQPNPCRRVRCDITCRSWLVQCSWGWCCCPRRDGPRMPGIRATRARRSAAGSRISRTATRASAN